MNGWCAAFGGGWQRGACGGMWLVLAFGMACTPGEGSGGAGPQRADSAADGQLSPPLSLRQGTWPPNLVPNSQWLDAAAGDEWAALRLGRSYTAWELLGWIALGGPAAMAAVTAYPTAEQAWEARGQLCQLIPSYDAASWAPLLRSVVLATEHSALIGEQLSTHATSECARALGVVEHRVRAGATGASAFVLDHVQSARQALAQPQTGSDG